MSTGIPRRIIQTGKSRALPVIARACAANLQCLNPDFEYRFFDNTEVDAFVRDEFAEYWEIFESFPFRIQKYDFFRYLAVYRLGGFYFDLDVFFAEGLRGLTDATCVFPFEELTLSLHLRRHLKMDWEIGNYGFGAAPNHPFLKAVIDNCVKAQRDPKWVEPMMQGIPSFFRRDFQVLNTTGPGLISRTLAENPDLASQVTVLFPEDVCDDRTWHHFGKHGVHAMEGSWRTQGNMIRRKLANIWEASTRRKGLAESRRLGPARNVASPNRTPSPLVSR